MYLNLIIIKLKNIIQMDQSLLFFQMEQKEEFLKMEMKKQYFLMEKFKNLILIVIINITIRMMKIF